MSWDGVTRAQSTFGMLVHVQSRRDLHLCLAKPCHSQTTFHRRQAWRSTTSRARIPMPSAPPLGLQRTLQDCPVCEMRTNRRQNDMSSDGWTWMLRSRRFRQSRSAHSGSRWGVERSVEVLEVTPRVHALQRQVYALTPPLSIDGHLIHPPSGPQWVAAAPVAFADVSPARMWFLPRRRVNASLWSSPTQGTGIVFVFLNHHKRTSCRKQSARWQNTGVSGLEAEVGSQAYVVQYIMHCNLFTPDIL